MYDRLALTAEPQSANLIPLGPRVGTGLKSSQNAVSSSSADADANAKVTPEPSSSKGITASSTFMMSNLQNKNKKKGFKSSALMIPPKIIFATEDPTPSSTPSTTEISQEQQSTPHVVQEGILSAEKATTSYRRLVAPSEKQEQGLLPSNMFVTSIDVEEGMHSNKKGKKREQVRDVDDSGYYGHETSITFVDPPSFFEELDYGTSAADNISKMAAEPDMASVEARWDSFPRIRDASQVVRDIFIGWKVRCVVLLEDLI